MLADVYKSYSWAHVGLSALPHLSVALGCFSQIIDLRSMEFILFSILFICNPFCVEIEWMIHELSLWENSILELCCYRDIVVNILLPSV
jgi:hypothetical protein